MTKSLVALCLVAACIVGMTAAQLPAVCSNAAPTTNFYLSPNCTSSFVPALQNFCRCVGGSWTDGTCNVTAKGCAQTCVATLIYSFNKAGEVACNADFNIALAAIAAGGSYAGSTLQASCNSYMCGLVKTYTPCSSADVISQVCVSPYGYHAVLGLSGDFAAAFNSDPAGLKLKVATDLTTQLGCAVTILSMKLASLVVEFSADANSGTTGFQTKLNTAATTTNWLTNVKAVVSNVGVTGITALPPVGYVDPFAFNSASTTGAIAAVLAATIFALLS